MAKRTRDEEIKFLARKFEDLKALRRNWDWQWEQLALYIQPGKADFITTRTTGDPARNQEVYDSTAMVANHTLASHMHSALTSPAAPWAELQFRDRELRNTDEAQEWIQDCTKRMFDAINDSNFVSTINETYQNLCCFGTACLETTHAIEDDTFRLVFRYIPLHALIFMENVHGRVDTVMHETKYTARQIKQLFPDKEIEQVEKALKADPETKLTMLKITRPNEKYDPEKDLSEKNRQFECIWTINSKEVRTDYYFELPFHIPRWSKMDCEVYGYGPGMLAYADIRSLNEAKRLELRGWEKALDAPMMAQAGNVIGDLHLEAGGFTQVRDIRGLTPLTSGTDWTATQIKAEDIRKSINSIFLIDQLILPERPNATATEVQIRYSMMQRVLGPTAGRLESELLNPLVNRIFGMMYRAGQFLPMPEGLGGAPIDVKYTGPLARAQESDETQAIENIMGIATQLLPVFPTALDGIDVPKALHRIATQRGVPADVLRSEEEIEAIQQQRQQQAQQQQQMAQAQQEQDMAQQQAQTEKTNAEAQSIQ